MKNQEAQINELKQALLKANQNIEKLSKVKSDFVSIISHELRTPLTSIKESVSLVLDEVTGPINEEQKRFLTMAKHNIDRLTKIIVDILDFSKMESGRITMHKRKMDINELIKDIYESVRSSVKNKNLKFDLKLSDKVKLTWFDPDRLGQALRNLISNAVKFNRKNGRISIYSSEEHINERELIKIVVEDTGIGITKEDTLRLFKDFNPLDTNMTRSYSGVGLGLAISRNIIQLHGGEIWAESEKDIGSKFIFTLPVYKKDEEFNFLLDETMGRVKDTDLKLALIIFEIKNPKDVNEKVLMESEKQIRSAVRGPEDKVVRFSNGDLIAIMACTDKEGAEKILKRLKKKIKVPLIFGVGIYFDSTQSKEDLIRNAREDLKSKKNCLSEA